MGIILIIFGLGGLPMKDKVMCLGMFGPADGSCLLITSGDNIFNMKGQTISKETAWAIQNLPPYISGLGGIFILGAIVQSSSRNKNN